MEIELVLPIDIFRELALVEHDPESAQVSDGSQRQLPMDSLVPSSLEGCLWINMSPWATQ